MVEKVLVSLLHKEWVGSPGGAGLVTVGCDDLAAGIQFSNKALIRT